MNPFIEMWPLGITSRSSENCAWLQVGRVGGHFGPQADAFSYIVRLTLRRRTSALGASAIHGVPSCSLAQIDPQHQGRYSPSCLTYSQRQPGQHPGLPLRLCLFPRGLGISIPSRSVPQWAHLDRGNCAVSVSSSSHLLPGQPQYRPLTSEPNPTLESSRR